MIRGSDLRAEEFSVEEAENLLERFQQAGFQRAFEVLWLYHQQRLGRLIRGRGLQPDQAEDVLQEVGFKLYRYLSRHLVEMFPPSAAKITKDQIADFYRSVYRAPEFQTLEELIALNLEPEAGPKNERMAQWRAAQKHMQACGLSRDQQTAVILHHLIGYSVAEVAGITESKHETVRARLRYAAQKMGRARRQQEVLCPS